MGFGWVWCVLDGFGEFGWVLVEFDMGLVCLDG